MFFRQVQLHADNFSYIIADEATREAAVVDASFNAGEILRVLKSEGFTLRYIVCTHGHSDHTAGNSELQSALGGQIVAHRLSKVRADVKVEDSQVLKVGKVVMKVIYTPGHTPDGICLLADGKKLLTGDTLFIGDVGRPDLRVALGWAATDLGALRAEVDVSLRKVTNLVDEINRKWPFARDMELKLP